MVRNLRSGVEWTPPGTGVREGMTLKTGTKAPTFALRDGNGKLHRLSQYKGRKVVLYFYPKDGTPGCTLEAEDFNRDRKKIESKGAVVLGVSPDNEVSHKRFSQELSLDFPLLADPDGSVSAKYGAYGERSLYGRKFNGIHRSTMIIDEDGKVAKVFVNVKVKGHTKEVLKSL